MKRYLGFLVVFLLLASMASAGVIHVIGSGVTAGGPCTVLQDSETTGNSSGQISPAYANTRYWMAGRCAYDGVTKTICAIEVNIKRVGNLTGRDYRVRVYGDDSGNGWPDGASIIATSDAVDLTSLSDAAFEWISFPISASISNGTVYWIALGCSSADDNNYVLWEIWYQTGTPINEETCKSNASDGASGWSLQDSFMCPTWKLYSQ